MVVFLLKRMLSLLMVVLGALAITFLLIRAQPGGPFDTEKQPPPEVKKELEERYGLNKPLPMQFLSYMDNLAHGRLGPSTHYRDRSVNEVLKQKLPRSFQLGFLAFVIASIGGVVVGGIAAMRQNSMTDYSIMFLVLLAISLPSFVTGPASILVFSLWLGWLPVGGWESWRDTILPSICLAAPFLATIARLMRNSLLDVLKQDYVRTAVAKGLSPSKVVFKHAMKVAILPVVTFLGPLAANLLTGSIVVESIFNINGAGPLFISSIQHRDAFLLGGVVLLYCVLLVIFNLVVDVVYSFLDKRIRIL